MSSYLDLEGLGIYHDKNKKYIDGKIPTKTSDLTNDSGFVTETALNTKAPLSSPVLTGTPKAPTATVGTNTTQIATTAFVQSAVSTVKNDLLNGAGGAYDTLKELGDLIDDNTDAIDALEAVASSKANASDLSSHTSDTTVHITSTERTNWNDANTKKHEHSNKTVLDNTTASYTTSEKTKLSGIATGAEVNQNAFSNVKVGSTTIAADSKTDTLTLVAGTNITLTPDATNDKITISSSGGTSYTLPVATSSALGGVKSGTDITVDSSGNVSVNDDSHNHVISNVDGLQSALNGKMNTKISNIELNSDGALANYGGFIDFHFNGSTDDYTSRIIEDASGQISMSKCSLKVQKEIYTYNNKLVPTIYSSTEPSSNLMNGLIWIG